MPGKKVIAKQSETERLKEENSQLKKIISSLPGHIYWKNAAGVYIGCNDEQARSAGFKNAGAMIKAQITDYDVPWIKDADLLRTIDLEVKNNKNTITREEPSKLADGKKRIFLSRKSPLYNQNNEPVGVIGVSIDITELKRLERQLKVAKEKAEMANQAKSEFLANVSHDIRTPLSAIIGMCEVFQSRLTNPQHINYANEMYSAANRLLDILNSVIEFTKIEAGVLTPHNEPIAVSKLINDTLSLCNDKNLTTETHFDENTPTTVVSDSIKLKRILLNLISNAIKFTEKGGVKINVALTKLKQQPALKFIIEDTGIGIPEDKLPYVFDRFTKASGSYQGNQGVGLGLSIVKRFVKDLHGKVKIISKLNHGTTVTCEIPIKLDNKNKETTKTKKITTKNITGAKKTTKNIRTKPVKLLLVEDDKICAFLQKTLLSDLGYEVTTADSGTQALKLTTQPFDLIICDIGLPDIDGIELIKQIKATQPINQNTLTICLTAHNLNYDMREATQAGITEIMQKPMDTERIKEFIEKNIP